MSEIVEMGTMSSRGQICIPADMRELLGLEEGTRVVFLCKNEEVLMKKVNSQTFAQLTKPLKEEAKRVHLKEENVEGIIHSFRKRKQ